MKIKTTISLIYHFLIFKKIMKCPSNESIAKDEIKKVAKKVKSSPLYLFISMVINSEGMPKYLQNPSS